MGPSDCPPIPFGLQPHVDVSFCVPLHFVCNHESGQRFENPHRKKSQLLWSTKKRMWQETAPVVVAVASSRSAGDSPSAGHGGDGIALTDGLIKLASGQYDLAVVQRVSLCHLGIAVLTRALRTTKALTLAAGGSGGEAATAALSVPFGIGVSGASTASSSFVFKRGGAATDVAAASAAPSLPSPFVAPLLYCTALSHIDLSHNQLTSLRGLEDVSRTLKSLDVSHNFLTDIHSTGGGMQDMGQLEVLKLHGNLISSASLESAIAVLIGLPKLRSLTFRKADGSEANPCCAAAISIGGGPRRTEEGAEWAPPLMPSASRRDSNPPPMAPSSHPIRSMSDSPSTAQAGAPRPESVMISYPRDVCRRLVQLRSLDGHYFFKEYLNPWRLDRGLGGDEEIVLPLSAPWLVRGFFPGAAVVDPSAAATYSSSGAGGEKGPSVTKLFDVSKMALAAEKTFRAALFDAQSLCSAAS